MRTTADVRYVALVMGCSASKAVRVFPAMIRARPSNPPTIGCTTRFQCVRQQFDPILTPEYFSVQHIGRRSEHIGRQRILAILFVFLTDLLRPGPLHQRLARKATIVG